MGMIRGVIAALAIEAVLGGIVWFAFTPPQEALQRTFSLALIWLGAGLIVRLSVTADAADNAAPVRPEPWSPQVGDRVYIRREAAVHQVVDVTGELVTLTNVNLPMSRVVVPASWVRPLPYVVRKAAA